MYACHARRVRGERAYRSIGRRFGPLTAVFVLVVMLATGCGGGTHRSLALPPVNADPERVVTTYVAALNAHDLRTARALLTPAHERLVESGEDSWFRNVRSVTHLHVNQPSIYRPHGHPPLLAIVGVRFVLDQYKVESMENGPTVWGYMLERQSPNQRWLIYDEGLG
jgi:hypothetical protein